MPDAKDEKLFNFMEVAIAQKEREYLRRDESLTRTKERLEKAEKEAERARNAVEHSTRRSQIVYGEISALRQVYSYVKNDVRYSGIPSVRAQGDQTEIEIFNSAYKKFDEGISLLRKISQDSTEHPIIEDLGESENLPSMVANSRIKDSDK